MSTEGMEYHFSLAWPCVAIYPTRQMFLRGSLRQLQAPRRTAAGARAGTASISACEAGGFGGAGHEIHPHGHPRATLTATGRGWRGAWETRTPLAADFGLGHSLN